MVLLVEVHAGLQAFLFTGRVSLSEGWLLGPQPVQKIFCQGLQLAVLPSQLAVTGKLETLEWSDIL